MCMYVVAISLL